MPKYVALLRGIGPGNPNMANAKLRQVMEDLGFTDVQTVISSGNVLFSSPLSDTAQLEKTIEAAWPTKLGFQSTTIVRSQAQLQALVDANPFKELEHGPGSYLLVTFGQKLIKPAQKLPYQPAGKPFKLLATVDGALCTVTDNTQIKTPDLMTWLEKEFGKQITSRTWLTVQRILKKLQS